MIARALSQYSRALGSTLAVLLLCASTEVLAQPAFSKSFQPDTIGPGSTSILTFVIANGDAAPVDQLAFTDVLPAGVTLADPASAHTNCVTASLTAPDGGSTISLSDARLGGLTTCTISVSVTSATPGTHTNVSGALTSSAGNSGTATADLTVDTGLPGFSASFSPSTIPVNATSTLTWAVDNSANPNAGFTFINFFDTLPPGLRIATPDNANIDCSNATLNTDIQDGVRRIRVSGAITQGEVCSFSMDVIAEAPGMFDYLSPNLDTGMFPTVLPAGRATATLEVERKELHKLFVGDPVPPGGTVDVEYTLTNLNRIDTATAITFTENFSSALAGLTFTSLTSNDCGGAVGGAGTGTLDFSGGSLGPEASCTLTATLTVPAGATPNTYTSTTSAVDYLIGGNPSSWGAATDQLVVSPVPILTKEFVDNPVGPGDSTTLRFTITNTSTTSGATDIEFIDELTTFLPFPVSVALPPVPDPPCSGGSSLALISLGTDRQGLELTGGSLAPAGSPGDSCTFEVTVDIPNGVGGRTLTNTTREIMATVDGETRAGLPASDDLEVAHAPRLTKEFIDDPVIPGGTVTLRYTMSHSDVASGDATAIAFTDNLAAIPGVTATFPPDPDPPCGSGSSLVGSAGDTFLTFSGGSLAPGGSCTFDVILDVAAGAPAGTFSSDTSNVTATVSGVSVTDNPASDDLQINGLTFSKEFLDDPTFPGDTVTLRFTIANDHPAVDATITFFTDNLQAELTGLAATGAPTTDTCGGTLSGTTFLVYTGGSVLSGEQCTIEVPVLVPGAATAGTYRNVTSGLAADLGGAVTVPPAVDILSVADPLLLTKEFLDDPVAPGGTVQLELTIHNSHATDTVTDIAFTDDLDAVVGGLRATGLPLAACGGTATTPDGGSTLEFDGGSLAAKETCSFTVTLIVPSAVPPGSPFFNVTSAVTGMVGSVAVTGDPATDELEIALVNLTKSFDRAVLAGQTVTLTFAIENVDTSNPVSGLSFADDLSAMLSGAVASGLPATDFCGPGSVLEGTSNLLLRWGNLGAGATCSFDVTVAVPSAATAGTYPNITTPLSALGIEVAEPASADLTVEPPPDFSKVFAPDTVGPDQPSTLTFTIDNSAGTAARDGIGFVDPLPRGMTVFNPPNAGFTCTGGTLTADPGSGVITYAGGTVAAGASCTVSVDVSRGGTGAIVNRSGPLQVAGITTTATATATLTLVVPPTFAKSFSPTTVFVNEVSTLTFAIDNTFNSSGASNLSFTDNLPLGMVVASSANVINSCTGGTVSAAPGSGVVTYTGGTVGASQSCSIQVDVVATSFGRLFNSSGDLTSSLGSSGNASAALEVEPPPTFAKQFAPTTVHADMPSVLTFTIDNAESTIDTGNLDFVDTLPIGMTVATPSGATTTCQGGTLTANPGADTVGYSGGTVPAGSSCVVRVNVVSAAVGVATNTTGDLTSDAGNSGSATDNLDVQPLPTLTKEFAPDVIFLGGTSRLTFTIDNSGSTLPANDADIIDPLPAGIRLATPANPATTCPGGVFSTLLPGGELHFFRANVGPGQVCTGSVDVAGDALGTHVNTTEDMTSTAGTSEAASDTLTVEPIPTLAKAFVPGIIPLGGASRLTLTIDNSNAAIDATGLELTDNLPPGTTVTSPANASTTCVGGVLNATAGGALVRYSGGTVAASTVCEILVDVTGAAVTTYSNTTEDLTSSAGNSGSASATLTVDDVPVFTKQFAPDAVNLGDTSTLTFLIDNSRSAGAVSALDFTDPLPVDVTVADPPNASTTCTGGTLTAVADAAVLSYTSGNVGAGESCTVTVDVVAAAVGSHVNTTGELTSSAGSSGAATDTLTVVPAPIFSKGFAPATTFVGQPTTLTFTIDNTGSVLAASNLAFTDALPAAISVATTPATSSTCGGGTITAAPGTGSINYTGGTVPAGDTCSIQVDVVGTALGTHINTSGDLTSDAGNSGPAQATLTVGTTPPFAKQFDPSAIFAGQRATLIFSITNTGNSVAVADLAFTDALPAGVSVAGPTNAVTTCGGSVAATPGGSVIGFSGGTVAIDTDCLVSVDVTANAPGVFNNISGDLTSNSGNSGPAAADLVVEPLPAFSKLFAPVVVNPGVPAALTFTVDNSASSLGVANLAFSDSLPAGLTVADPANASTTCTGGTLNAVAGAGVISYAGGSVDAQTACVIVVDVTSTTEDVYNNVCGDLTSSAGNSGPSSATLTVDARPGFDKAFSPTAVWLDGVSTLTFTIDNSRATAAVSALDFTDNLPAGVTVATPPNATTTCTGGTVTAVAGANAVSFAGGSLAAGSSCLVTVDVTGAAVGSHANLSGPLTSSAGNSGGATADLRVEPLPSFTKAFTGDVAIVGASVTVTFTIDNSGSSLEATNLDFVDNLPSGLTVASPANASTTCTGGTLTATDGSDVISYTDGTIIAASSCVVEVEVTATAAGSLVNTTGDLTSSAGNSGPAAATITAAPLPLLSKEFGTATIVVGDTVTLTFTIDNSASTLGVGDLAFADDLPTGMVVAPEPQIVGTCTSGSATAAPGAGVISFAGGSLAAGASCTLEVVVTSSVVGEAVNVTDALVSDLGTGATATATLIVQEATVPTVARGGCGCSGSGAGGAWLGLVLLGLVIRRKRSRSRPGFRSPPWTWRRKFQLTASVPGIATGS